MSKYYKVWPDSESRIRGPKELSERKFASLDEAYNTASELAHEHDFKEYRAIFHVDVVSENVHETVETVENFV